jgi:hypothetical protein
MRSRQGRCSQYGNALPFGDEAPTELCLGKNPSLPRRRGRRLFLQRRDLFKSKRGPRLRAGDKYLLIVAFLRDIAGQALIT